MSEDQNKPKTPDSMSGWDKLVWEFFDCIFKDLIPGSIAVYFYAPHLAQKMMESTGFVSAFVFLGLAWVTGVILDVMTLHIRKLLLFLFGCREEWLPEKPWVDGLNGRMWFAQKAMFRSIAALALCYVVISLFIWLCTWLSSPTQPSNLSVEFLVKLLALGIFSFICFCFMHKTDLDRAKKK